MARNKLTAAQVHLIRTSGYTDSYWGRRLRLSDDTIRRARMGIAYRHVPTPADTQPREGTGSTHAVRHGLPQPAREKRERRSWL